MGSCQQLGQANTRTSFRRCSLSLLTPISNQGLNVAISFWRTLMLQKLLRYVALTLVTIITVAPMSSAQLPRHEKVTLEDLLAVEPPGAPVLSPDGTKFAMIRNDQIALMPSEGGWPMTLTTTAGGKSGVAWSGDG